MNTKEKKPCPIPITHRRINHALAVFEDINASYQTPEKFTSDLNNLIQALRNITFMLQSEKSKIKDFDAWYKPIQNSMKADDVMRWLIDARNHVVKQGDLEKDSYLFFRIVDHFNHELISEKFDPLIDTETAIKWFKEKAQLKIPDILKDEIVIEAERKWVISTYPKAEVVDVLIYCFSILADVVNFAHETLGSNIINCEENHFFEEQVDFMVVLHNKLKAKRLTRILYAQNAIISSSMSKMPIEEIFSKDIGILKDEVSERYGNVSDFLDSVESTEKELPFSMLRFHVESAKKFIVTDGYVMTVCFFYYADEKQPPRMMIFEPRDPSSRFSMAEKIAEVVEETHCKAIVFVSEMWIGKMPENTKEYIPARLQKDKKEGVSILAASPNKTQEVLIPFCREADDKIILEPEKNSENGIWPFLNKVEKIWEQWEEFDRSKESDTKTETGL